MTPRRLLLLAAALPALASAAVAPVPESRPAADISALPGATVVAKVEDRIITIDDVRRLVYPRVNSLRSNARNEKEFYDMLDQLQSDVLNDLINRLLVVHDFKKDGRRRIPASMIDDYVAETLHKDYGDDRTAFLQYLRNNGWAPRDFRQHAEEDLIYLIMRQQHRKSETVVSPRQVEDYYNAHKDSADFRQEDAVLLRLITVKRAAGESNAALLARVQPILTRLNAGEKFEALARELSEDVYRDSGGEMGWREKSKMISEFSAPAFTLEKGAFSGPILRDEACHLLYVVDRKAAGLKPLAEVSGEIQKELAAQLGREAESRWLARLRETYYVRIYPLASPAPAANKP
jgi:peptidyl-prolyl cis-trans isomerase SurA